jgi:hypothetical protein
MRGFLARRVVGLAATFALAAVASAQEAVVSMADAAGRELCVVRANCFAHAGAGLGFGFAHIDVDNRSAMPQQVEVSIGSPKWHPNDVGAVRSVRVEAGQSAHFFLPLPMPQPQYALVARIDGQDFETDVNLVGRRNLAGLLVADRPESAPAGLTVLQAVPRQDKVEPAQIVCGTSELPADWRWLTAFAAIVVDGTAALQPAQQEALRRYAFVGGRVLVAAPERLPHGPLRDVAAAPSAARHGLGAVLGLPGLGGDTTMMRAVVEQLPPAESRIWPLDDELFLTQAIAGLGEAPVTLFVLVIVVFALLAGPINFYVLRRRRRPLLVLLTVPLLGFGTTAGILLYGLFNDGFTVRGVERSWTMLDQARRETAAITTRTLFAGLAPASLVMAEHECVFNARALRRDRRAPDRWRFAAADERLDGGILPSRVSTPLVSAQQGPARQRLVVQQSGDELVLLTDGGIAPVGVVVLRDLDGNHWLGEAPRLRRAVGGAVDQALLRLKQRAGTFQYVDPEGGRGEQFVTTVAQSLYGQPLPPGGYACMVREAPWLSAHGLEIELVHGEHYVLGRLHAEDFVR